MYGFTCHHEAMASKVEAEYVEGTKDASYGTPLSAFEYDLV